jgi:predicted transposase/invertase (TIGR01784 family)
VQAEAVKELLALPKTHPYRQETLRHLMVLQVNLKIRQNKTKDLREVMMSLAPAYEKWLEETLAQGRQEGRQEGQVEVALRLLQRKMAIAEVAECTGLSVAEVKKLRP